jgi:hypothetical protein
MLMCGCFFLLQGIELYKDNLALCERLNAYYAAMQNLPALRCAICSSTSSLLELVECYSAVLPIIALRLQSACPAVILNKDSWWHLCVKAGTYLNTAPERYCMSC